jgi:hypothetical protein
MLNMKERIFVGIILTTLIAGGGYYLYQKYNPFTYYDDEVHVHADFMVIVNDEWIRLTDEKYQSSVKQVLHKNVHLHDGKDDVVHRHADGITFANFLSSIGFTLTNECLTNDQGTSYCADDNNVLTLYVNGVPKTILTEYIPEEEDKVLLYYGSPANPKISEYQSAITNNSCFYSGTCPERGIAPPESCGLTCEI